MNGIMKFLIELGPLAAFFIAYQRFGLMTATAVIMAATAIAIAASWLLTRKVAKVPLISALLIGVFGGLTLWLGDPVFIKVKPTIIYLLFAGALGGGLVFGRSLLKPLFEMAFRLPEQAWRTLTLRWAVFFFAMAVLNEAVWRTMATDFWVDVKVFGFLPLTFLFALSQVPFISRHHLGEAEESEVAAPEAGE